MVAITWTPQLMHAVKEIKKLEKSKIAILFNERKYVDSFQISQIEEQAVNLVIYRNTSPASPAAYWS